jgi:hypothetical protein
LLRFDPAGVYLGAALTWFEAFRREEPPFTKQQSALERLNQLAALIDNQK